ncbi:MAG: glycoside hydrolase family protein [Prevotella sp.]|nr:glycoside hydrolase family protein [Massilibacteroides sp.]
MDVIKLQQELIRDEGLYLDKYICPSGKPTIGVGHQLIGNERHIKRITLKKAGEFLEEDIHDAQITLDRIFGNSWLSWTEARQHALLNMAFNIGETRLRGFKNMIAAIKAQDWPLASREVKDSLYYKKLTRRAERVRCAVLNG